MAGERPVLAPGQCFQYQAACPLRTPKGWVEGYFEMWTRVPSRTGGDWAWGEPFKAVVGRFGLNSSEPGARSMLQEGEGCC